MYLWLASAPAIASARPMVLDGSQPLAAAAVPTDGAVQQKHSDVGRTGHTTICLDLRFSIVAARSPMPGSAPQTGSALLSAAQCGRLSNSRLKKPTATARTIARRGSKPTVSRVLSRLCRNTLPWSRLVENISMQVMWRTNIATRNAARYWCVTADHFDKIGPLQAHRSACSRVDFAGMLRTPMQVKAFKH